MIHTSNVAVVEWRSLVSPCSTHVLNKASSTVLMAFCADCTFAIGILLEYPTYAGDSERTDAHHASMSEIVYVRRRPPTEWELHRVNAMIGEQRCQC